MDNESQLISTVTRREKIIELVCDNGSVSVNKLSQLFSVSTVTIRNDLSHLENKGCVFRYYGGAVLNKQFAFDKSLQFKSGINSSNKNIIAQCAAELVQDGDRIILDSGSTTALMVPYLKNKRDLIVMTNALNIAYDLATNTDIDVLIAGGNVRKNTYSITGPTTEQLLSMYHFNKLFLGIDGIDLDAGITTANFSEATVNKAMCHASQQIIAITDSTKFGRKSFCLIESIENIDSLITDSHIPDNYLSALQEKNITIILADKTDHGGRFNRKNTRCN